MRPELGDRRLLIGGGAVIGLLVVDLLFGGGDGEPPAPVAPSAPHRQPAPPSRRSLRRRRRRLPPEGLRLYGLTGVGAIIGPAGGGQRLVAVGREVIPGLTLAAVSIDHAMLRSSSGDYGWASTAWPRGAAARGLRPLAAATAALREETLRYRLGLAPRRRGGPRYRSCRSPRRQPADAGARRPAPGRCDHAGERLRHSIRRGWRNSPGRSPIAIGVTLRDRAGRPTKRARHRALIVVTLFVAHPEQKYFTNITKK